MSTVDVVNQMDERGTLGLGAAALDDDEIDALLRETGIGVLSMASDGVAYPLPLSFGYDGERLYFAFLASREQGRKHRFAEATERAAFLVFDVGSKHDWRSAAVYGPLARLPPEEEGRAIGAHRDNAWHSNLYAAPGPKREIEWWTLTIEDATGRRSATDPGVNED